MGIPGQHLHGKGTDLGAGRQHLLEMEPAGLPASQTQPERSEVRHEAAFSSPVIKIQRVTRI